MNKGQLYPGRAALVLNLLFILSASSFGSVVWAQAPEKDFRDDFAGASLRPEWNLTDQDKNRWDLVNDDYLILVLKDDKNKFCYKYEVPERYEFILKLIVTEELGFGDFFYIGIDNKNSDGIKIMISPNQWIIKKTLGKDTAQMSRHAARVSDEEAEYYMKIQKKGIEYIGYISRDANSWTEVGRYSFPRFAGSPCFGDSRIRVVKEQLRLISSSLKL